MRRQASYCFRESKNEAAPGRLFGRGFEQWQRCLIILVEGPEQLSTKGGYSRTIDCVEAGTDAPTRLRRVLLSIAGKALRE